MSIMNLLKQWTLEITMSSITLIKNMCNMPVFRFKLSWEPTSTATFDANWGLHASMSCVMAALQSFFEHLQATVPRTSCSLSHPLTVWKPLI